VTRGVRAAVLAGAWLAALALGACQPGGDDAAFGRRVRAYLLAHPEVLQEAMQKLEARQAAKDAADQQSAQRKLPALRAAVEHDPADFVANPGGAITVTEFYDYRCPHCIDAAPQVLALIRQHPDVRVVFKEMPIFGAVSQHAALAALTVQARHGDYLGLYQAMMTAPALDDATIDRLAAARGVRLADEAAEAPRAAAQLRRTGDLFNQLDLGGTPAFIVGDQIVLGDDMKGLDTAIAHARAARPA
jgi:protein-disulfide isomerase